MEDWFKNVEDKNNRLEKAWETQGLSASEDFDNITKAKYFKREGTPGNYKYYYTEAEYNQAVKKKVDKTGEKKKDQISKMHEFKAEKTLNKKIRFEDGDMSYKQRIDSGKIYSVKEKNGKYLAFEDDETYREVPKAIFDYYQSKGETKKDVKIENSTEEKRLTGTEIKDIIQTLKNDNENPNDLSDSDWKEMGVTSKKDIKEIKGRFNIDEYTISDLKNKDKLKQILKEELPDVNIKSISYGSGGSLSTPRIDIFSGNMNGFTKEEGEKLGKFLSKYGIELGGVYGYTPDLSFYSSDLK